VVNEKKDQNQNEGCDWSSRPYKYTDDIVGSIIILAYIFQNNPWIPLSVPDWALAASLLWLFGSRVADLIYSVFKKVTLK